MNLQKHLGMVIALCAIIIPVILCACANLGVRRYEQAGLKITGGRLKITEPNSMNFEALRVSSSGTAISRFKFQLGIDKSNPRDGQLTDPPDQIITNIDNSNASNEVLIASVSFGTTSPEDVIAHAEVYQGSGTTPVWSETWHSGQSAYGF